MEETYFNLKHKLEELGYNSQLPLDAVPLVECILADLLQTTRSLQHYMDLSKKALLQRDSLMLEAEPYKCDNIKLIQENNQLHQDNIIAREEILKLNKDFKYKIKTLTLELSKKEELISKLQHDIRDLSLRGLCADTLSSRNRSKKREGVDNFTPKLCICKESGNSTNENISELKININSLQSQIQEYINEIDILKNQVENRDAEIVRLKILLESGRPLKFNENAPENNIQKLKKEIKELEILNENLRKEMDKSLEKQHEAMLRALSLADKNKSLQEELEKVDKLALKVEESCNQKLQSMTNDIICLQNKIKILNAEKSKLDQEWHNRNMQSNPCSDSKFDGRSSSFLKDKENLEEKLQQDLVELNHGLKDKIYSLSQIINNFQQKLSYDSEFKSRNNNSIFKDELQTILEDERKKYEICLNKLQEKLNETINTLTLRIKNKHQSTIFTKEVPQENLYVRDLHVKLCESEHKILMLKKENDELKSKIDNQELFDKRKYQDIINHLNVENTELSKENILLSQQISQFKAITAQPHDRGDSFKEDTQRLNEKINVMANELKIIQKDKSEYHARYKEAMELVDKLKRDLLTKEKEIHNLEEENCSYRITNRTGKASAEHLKDECKMLREQLLKLQNDIIREKTITSQIKSVQSETERSSNELQNELLNIQKKLSLSDDKVRTLEETCKKLQSEIVSLKNEKVNLMDNIKLLDKERDKLVIELDNKTENITVLEQKNQSSAFEISRLENEIVDLKRKLNLNRVSQHKVVDYESQISFLNGEILRLNKQYDTAVMENKRLQNSLAEENAVLKLTKIEFEKSKRDVDSLKQQLQHYVAEIRRIEELLSEKEAERSDMLEQFASLSVEANILENTNHSLESESASKSLQLQSYISKIQALENKIIDKNNMIDSQSARIAAMTCKITTLESDIKLLNEEKMIIEQNVSYLKKMCNDMQSNEKSASKSMMDHESEIKLYENKIKNLNHMKNKLDADNEELKTKLRTTEKLLSDARNEVIELKLALQDAKDKPITFHELTGSSKDQGNSSSEHYFSKELDLPLLLEDRIDEVSNEDDEISEHSNKSPKNKYFYTHSSTL